MDKDKIIEKLTEIFDLELSGVIRYTLLINDIWT